MGIAIIIILVGLFVIVNSGNLVDVFQGTKTFNILGGTATPASTGGTSGGGTWAATDANTTLAQFEAAIAHVESGGNYNAVNAKTGAIGKYQILPSNWRAWAAKILGNANAPTTPANQEAIAAAKFQEYYAKYGSWQAVAHAWYTGSGSGSAATWSQQSINYVNKVLSQLGLTIQ